MISFSIQVSRYFPSLPDGSWKVDGTMTVHGIVADNRFVSANLLDSFGDYLQQSRAEAGLYRAGDFEVLWSDGKVETVK